MSSAARVPQTAPASSVTAAARAPVALPLRVDAGAAANDDAEAVPAEDYEASPNPLWMITVAMAVFFGFAALLITLG